MDAIAATIQASPAVKAGLEFVWIISFGQVATITITVLGILWAAARVFADVRNTKKELIAMRIEMRAMSKKLDDALIAMLTVRMNVLERVPAPDEVEPEE